MNKIIDFDNNEKVIGKFYKDRLDETKELYTSYGKWACMLIEENGDLVLFESLPF